MFILFLPLFSEDVKCLKSRIYEGMCRVQFVPSDENLLMFLPRAGEIKKNIFCPQCPHSLAPNDVFTYI